jgi:hypothetical protein
VFGHRASRLTILSKSTLEFIIDQSVQLVVRATVQAMQFTKRLREGVRRGRIRCSVRIWTRPHVKVGGRYRMDDGHIVVDSITLIASEIITDDLAQESGFDSVEDLLQIARHGRGNNVYLIRFHYLRPGAWDTGTTSRRGHG